MRPRRKYPRQYSNRTNRSNPHGIAPQPPPDPTMLLFTSPPRWIVLVLMVVAGVMGAAVAAPALGQSGDFQTLRDVDGRIMRGTPLIVSGNSGLINTSTAFATDPRTLMDLQERGFNTVRVCLVDAFFEFQSPFDFWTIEEQLPAIDTIVENATLLGMNVILNYHSFNEQANLTNLDFAGALQYWEVLAPRYAGNDRVFYEIVNEPSFIGDDYLNKRFRRGLLSVYRRVRELAPEQQILMFSFNNLGMDYESIVDAYRGQIDWDKTSIAWHAYGETQRSTADIQDLSRRYRTICTEWDYPGTFSYVPESLDGFEVHAGAFEQLGSSWIDWRNWEDASLDRIDGILLPDAFAKNYFWGQTETSPQMIVDSLTMSGSRLGDHSRASALVKIVDEDGDPVYNARVTLRFTGVLTGLRFVRTNQRGTARVFSSTERDVSGGDVTATIIRVRRRGFVQSDASGQPLSDTLRL